MIAGEDADQQRKGAELMQGQPHQHGNHVHAQRHQQLETEARSDAEDQGGHPVGGQLHRQVDDRHRDVVDPLQHPDQRLGALFVDLGESDPHHQGDEDQRQHIRAGAGH